MPRVTQIPVSFVLPAGAPDCCCGTPDPPPPDCGCTNLPTTLYGRITFAGLGVTWDYEPFTLHYADENTPFPGYDPTCPGAQWQTIPTNVPYYYSEEHPIEWIPPAPPGIFPADVCRLYLWCTVLSATEIVWAAYAFANDHIYWNDLYTGCYATLPMSGLAGDGFYTLEISDTPY